MGQIINKKLGGKNLIYFDNASTTYYKPKEVIEKFFLVFLLLLILVLIINVFNICDKSNY